MTFKNYFAAFFVKADLKNSPADCIFPFGYSGMIKLEICGVSGHGSAEPGR
jgi:hypothetical protein